MIPFGKILKRSWQILWNYRVLWIFGILLALTTGWNSGNNGGSSRTSSNNISSLQGTLPADAPQWMRQLGDWFVQNVEPLIFHPEQHVGTIAMVIGIVVLISLALGALTAFVRYPAESAVIRMVDDYETSGARLGFRQGWKLGWTRRAFRLWLIDLILSLPVLVFLAVIAAGLLVYFNVASSSQTANVISVLAAVGLGILSVLVLIVGVVFLNLLRHFFARAAVLEGQGVNASLHSGWAMFKRNWKSAGLMWLVMVGIGLGAGLAAMLLFFLLIPAYLVMLLPAAIVAVLPALIGFGVTSLFAGGPLAWIVAVLAAAPFFFIVLFAPIFFFGGWYKIYESNIWTLTYREMKALENLAADLPAEPAAPAAAE